MANAPTIPTPQDRAREGKLVEALIKLETDYQYYPLSYLAGVGVLPRYGFPGDTVTITDDRQRQISQSAAVGITEYAPGNMVYVGGRKLQIDRVLFRGGSKDDPRQNAETYAYCPTCNYVALKPTGQTALLAVECEYCHQPLSPARYVDYDAAHGRDRESITQDDEYRDRQDYKMETYLLDSPAPPVLSETYAGWEFHYSRLRSIEIFNRGLIDRARGGIAATVVCLECGNWREPSENDAATAKRGERLAGHAPWCTVTTWESATDDRIVDSLHLRAHLQGDVVEMRLSPVAAHNAAWVKTMAQALILGMQLELFIGSGEVDFFARYWTEANQQHAALVFYDTMPGGTGYLKRLVENLPQIAARALAHLEDCACEKACYRCLMEFWNQRVHALLDKRLVISALRTLAAANPNAPTPTPLDPDTRFDSFLESQFYTLLAAHGLPLPKTQEVVRDQAGRPIVRADFRYEAQRLIILTDGRQFHTRDAVQIQHDLNQRNLLARDGWQLLEFTYHDVEQPPAEVVRLVKVALDLEPLGLTVEMAPPSQLTLSDGRSITALTSQPAQKHVTLSITPAVWIANPAHWTSDLDLHNHLRLCGWRVERVIENA